MSEGVLTKRDFRYPQSRYKIKNEQMKVVDERKDTRKKLGEVQPIVAECKSKDYDFKASVYDVSSSGVFILTRRPLSTGQEIAIKFRFPKAGETIMATGEIVRVSNKEVGVELKILFQDKNCQLDISEMA
jgi:hypothetical protein